VGNDADVNFAQGLWCLSLHLPASLVVETGVARGISTAVVLDSFAQRQGGRLWSIDMPPLREPWYSEHQAAIAPELRNRWTYVRGSSRRYLPKVLSRLGSIDLFIHDSSRTKRNMLFEMNTAWSVLRRGGAMLIDGAGEHDGFEEGIRRLEGVRYAGALEMSDKKGGAYGLVLK
jgi:predicted O-methyltransferase YrrM